MRQSGSVMIFFMLLLPFVVIPVVGLGIDGAMCFIVKAKMQAAVDAGALAASQSMSGEPGEGLLFVGDTGKILCGFNGSRPRLIPASRMKAFTPPPKTLPRSPGNDREWLDACKGSKTKPGANFAFSGMVTETLQLANVATHLGQNLDWDRSGLKVTNVASAQPYLSPARREGWEL